MQVGVRIIPRLSSSIFPRPPSPPLYSSPRRLRRKLSLSAAPPKQCELNEESEKFLQWLRQRTGAQISSALTLGNSIHGRSLFASKNIKAGECIFQVPFTAQITSENIPSEVIHLLPGDVANISLVAIVLLAEMKLGEHSRWATYVDSLPCLDEMHNAIFWSRDELEMIRESPVYQETISEQACIKEEYLALRPVLDQFSHVFGEVHLEDFMHAFALVSSRAWDLSKGETLIPFADFLNHDDTWDGVSVCDDVDNETCEVFANRDYAAGEEVMTRYAKISNARLLLDFGFTLPYNMHDKVPFWLDVPSHDPLYEMKNELLEKHSLRRIMNAARYNSSWNYFIIKEVKSANGNGKGIPQALRAFVRVLSATSVEELQALVTKAAEDDGRLARCPLKSKEREIQAHRILCSRLFHMIQGHDSALKGLESVDVTDCNSRQSVRAQMAKDLLNGELRVMKSAHAWLANYCTSLCSQEEAN